jgi:hypothetical protein
VNGKAPNAVILHITVGQCITIVYSLFTDPLLEQPDAITIAPGRGQE